MRNSFSFLVIILVLGVVTGCGHRLPNLKAKEIHQTISFPGFSSTADATGINITETKIIAEDASWRLSVLGVTTVTTAKGYEQKREKEDPK